MRKAVLVAAVLAFAAAVSWASSPASALPISSPTALQDASDSIGSTEKVWCDWRGCERPYYRPYYRPTYRPYYRSYDRPYYRSYGYRSYEGYERPYYRPYDRPYYSDYPRYSPGYRSVPWWLSGPY